MMTTITKEKTSAGRQVYIDILRVIATVFVIAVHTASLGASVAQAGSTQWYAFEIAGYLFLSCNLLFIMISGALLLPVKGERAGVFYRKRFLKVLVPMIVYYILYVCAKEGFRWLLPANWPALLQRILTGAPEEAPHFWLIYVILWLYVLTPVIRYLIQHIPDSVYNGLILVILAAQILYTYCDPLYFNPVYAGIIGSFAGVFIAGYYLTKDHPKWLELLIFGAGAGSVILAICHIFSGNAYDRYIYNHAPLMMFYTMALFLAVKKLFISKQTESHFITLISRYSFGILLIHWGILHVLVKQILHVNVLAGYGILGSLAMVLLTLFFSLIGAAVIDFLLISPILRGISILFDKLSGKTKK